jgi:protein-disulfide isomerase
MTQQPSTAPGHEPIRLPEAPSESTPGDVIVINQQVIYYAIVAVMFFAAGFLIAWIVFSSRADDVRSAASNAAREAVRTAIAEVASGAAAQNATPTPIPRQDVRYSDSMASWGPKDSKVTIVEFSDFECPFCSRLYSRAYKQIREKYGSRVRFVFRHFPLTSIHPNALGAALASECAKEQAKFWEYHDVLFENQRALQRDSLIQYARQVGVANIEQFTQCFDQSKYLRTVQEDMADGEKYFVNGTPTLFINGNYVAGAQEFEIFAAIIERELLGRAGG